MKEKIIKEIIEHFYQNISKEEREIVDEMGVAKQLETYIYDEIKDLDEEESIYYLNKLKLSLEQADLGYTIDDVDYKSIEIGSNINNFIVRSDVDKKIYTLDELLRECSLKQLNLYNEFYSYKFNIYHIEKINDKEKLINSLKKDIIFSFKKYIKQAKKKEIILFKNALDNNGCIDLDNINEELWQCGYFIPFKFQKRKIKYVMSQELLDIIKDYDFAITSEDTKKFVAGLIEYFMASKGVVSKEEFEDFFIGVADFNIKKEELFDIVDNRFTKKDDYYYVEKMLTDKVFNELVKVKKEIPYLPSYEELLSFKVLVDDLNTLLLKISNKDVKMGRVAKDLFYKPIDEDILIDKLSKKLKINKKDVDLLDEFLYENIDYFSYWIYNGESEDFDDFFDFSDLDIDLDYKITETDLPF